MIKKYDGEKIKTRKRVWKYMLEVRFMFWVKLVGGPMCRGREQVMQFLVEEYSSLMKKQ